MPLIKRTMSRHKAPKIGLTAAILVTSVGPAAADERLPFRYRRGWHRATSAPEVVSVACVYPLLTTMGLCVLKRSTFLPSSGPLRRENASLFSSGAYPFGRADSPAFAVCIFAQTVAY